MDNGTVDIVLDRLHDHFHDDDPDLIPGLEADPIDNVAGAGAVAVAIATITVADIGRAAPIIPVPAQEINLHPHNTGLVQATHRAMATILLPRAVPLQHIQLAPGLNPQLDHNNNTDLLIPLHRHKCPSQCRLSRRRKQILLPGASPFHRRTLPIIRVHGLLCRRSRSLKDLQASILRTTSRPLKGATMLGILCRRFLHSWHRVGRPRPHPLRRARISRAFLILRLVLGVQGGVMGEVGGGKGGYMMSWVLRS